MAAVISTRTARAFAGVAIAAAVATIALGYWSGCAGDAKTGGRGSPALALEREQLAVLAALICALASAASQAFNFAIPVSSRLARTLAFPALTLVLLWLSVFFVEGMGVSSCAGA